MSGFVWLNLAKFYADEQNCSGRQETRFASHFIHICMLDLYHAQLQNTQLTTSPWTWPQASTTVPHRHLRRPRTTCCLVVHLRPPPVPIYPLSQLAITGTSETARLRMHQVQQVGFHCMQSAVKYSLDWCESTADISPTSTLHYMGGTPPSSTLVSHGLFALVEGPPWDLSRLTFFFFFSLQPQLTAGRHRDKRSNFDCFDLVKRQRGFSGSNSSNCLTIPRKWRHESLPSSHRLFVVFHLLPRLSLFRASAYGEWRTSDGAAVLSKRLRLETRTSGHFGSRKTKVSGPHPFVLGSTDSSTCRPSQLAATCRYSVVKSSNKPTGWDTEMVTSIHRKALSFFFF